MWRTVRQVASSLSLSSLADLIRSGTVESDAVCLLCPCLYIEGYWRSMHSVDIHREVLSFSPHVWQFLLWLKLDCDIFLELSLFTLIIGGKYSVRSVVYTYISLVPQCSWCNGWFLSFEIVTFEFDNVDSKTVLHGKGVGPIFVIQPIYITTPGNAMDQILLQTVIYIVYA